jgi:hypothetical protein
MMDRSIKTVRQLEPVFKLHRMVFKELKKVRSSSHHNVSAKKRKYEKTLNFVLWGRRSIIRGFLLFAGCLGT